ncbi:MAG: helix-turn-helix domain-containing protein [Candidatus Kapaibacterium sp.]
MKRHELRQLILEGEGLRVEFKRKFSTHVKFAKEISAFANTKGGVMLVGVDDNGRIIGVDSEKEQIDLAVSSAEFYLEPPVHCRVECIEVDWKEVVVIHVQESQTKPHMLKVDPDQPSDRDRRAYIRNADQSVLASKEMMRLMSGRNPLTRPMTLHIGDRERRLFAFLEEHRRITVKEFADLVNISLRRSSQILVRLVRAEVLNICTDKTAEFFTLAD